MYANLFAQNFRANKPNQIWMSDITYIHTDEGWLYLTSGMDLYTRKIVGWHIGCSYDERISNSGITTRCSTRNDY